MLFTWNFQWSLWFPGFCDNNLPALIFQNLMNLPWPAGPGLWNISSGMKTNVTFHSIQMNLMESALNRYYHKENYYKGVGDDNYIINVIIS